MEQKKSSPSVHVSDSKEIAQKMGKLKVAFLYILIGGLVISALISVVAILIGEFNEAVLKALLTTFIFVTHSLLVIGIVSADRRNRLGKDVIPTAILATVIANMFTSTLGTWELWASDASWKAFLVYMLVIGAAFIVTASLKLRLGAHKATNYLVYGTTGLVILLTALLVPWIVVPEADWVNSFYYRLIGAVTILAATTLSVSVIINRIAASQKPELTKKNPVATLPGGMLAVYITFGTVVGMFWFYGLFAFIGKATTIDRYESPRYNDRFEVKDYNNRYR